MDQAQIPIVSHSHILMRHIWLFACMENRHPFSEYKQSNFTPFFSSFLSFCVREIAASNQKVATGQSSVIYGFIGKQTLQSCTRKDQFK